LKNELDPPTILIKLKELDSTVRCEALKLSNTTKVDDSELIVKGAKESLAKLSSSHKISKEEQTNDDISFNDRRGERPTLTLPVKTTPLLLAPEDLRILQHLGIE
jgi:hypothetical protein